MLGEDKDDSRRFLEIILKHQNGTVIGNFAAGSLYDFTGEQYEFIRTDGVKQKFYPGDIDIAARQVIKESYGRKRAYNEMLVLDSTFRPPAKRKGYKKYLR